VKRSNKDRVKKRRERFWLEQCFAAAGLSLDVVAERETPDFVLCDEGGEFGVELAEVFNDRRLRANGKLASPGREGERRRSRYLSGVARDYYTRGGLPLSVRALLSSATELPDPDDLVDRLVAGRPAEASGRVRIEMQSGAVFDLLALPDEFPNYSHWFVDDDHVGLVLQTTDQEVQAIIRAKASEKLSACRQVCGRMTLLLHADRTVSSGMILWVAEFAPIEPCGFDEVLLYLHPREVWRLSPGSAERLGSGSGAVREAER